MEDKSKDIDPKQNFWGFDFDEINLNNRKNTKEFERVKHKNMEKNEGNIITKSKTTKEQDRIVSANKSGAKEDSELSRKIENIRSNYILGKIVGEDLKDNQGNIIASKNSLITEEIIYSAEEAGKLPELIINMIFPEEEERS